MLDKIYFHASVASCSQYFQYVCYHNNRAWVVSIDTDFLREMCCSLKLLDFKNMESLDYKEKKNLTTILHMCCFGPAPYPLFPVDGIPSTSLALPPAPSAFDLGGTADHGPPSSAHKVDIWAKPYPRASDSLETGDGSWTETR